MKYRNEPKPRGRWIHIFRVAGDHDAHDAKFGISEEASVRIDASHFCLYNE